MINSKVTYGIGASLVGELLYISHDLSGKNAEFNIYRIRKFKSFKTSTKDKNHIHK